MVDLIKTVVAAAVGGIDIALEKQNRVVFHNLKLEDIYRIAVCGGSLVAEYLGLDRYGYAETAFYASIPLLEKTIARIATGGGGEARAVRTVRATAEFRPISDVFTVRAPVETKEKAKEEVVEVISI